MPRIFPFQSFWVEKEAVISQDYNRGAPAIAHRYGLLDQGSHEVLRSDKMPLSYSMFVRKGLTTKRRKHTFYGMLRLKKFINWKNQKSPLNRWEFLTEFFRGLKNLFRCNSSAISDCKAFSALELNRNRHHWRTDIMPKLQRFVYTTNRLKVILGIDWHFLINIEYSQGVWMRLFLEIVIVSISEFSFKFPRCRDHGDFRVDRNDLWNCLAFSNNHKTLTRGLNKTFCR